MYSISEKVVDCDLNMVVSCRFGCVCTYAVHAV